MDIFATTQAEPVPRDPPEGSDGRESPRETVQTAPLSAEQRQIWLHAALAPAPALYNEQVIIRRHGDLDPTALAQSLDALIRRHETLRTVFADADGEPVQIVRPAWSIPVRSIDLGRIPPARREEAASEIAAEQASRPFDLGEGPLLRAIVLRLANDDHRLCLTIHHLIVDSLSVNRVLLPELAAFYEAYARGDRPALPPLLLHYRDYAIWRQQQVDGAAIAARTKAWGRRLAGAPGTVPIPTDRQRPAALSYRGAVESIEYPPELTRALKAFSTAEGVSLYMTLLAGFSALLHRYTGQDDILVGGIASTRRRPGLDRLIGCFINVVALRTRPSAAMSFREHLAQTREAVLSGLVAGDVPFDLVVREVQPKREPSVQPLVQALLSLETAEPVADGWEATYLDGSSGTSKFDLSISLHEHGERLVGRIVYSADLFAPETMRRLIGHWMTLLAGAAADPGCALARLPLLTEAETRELLVGWNQTERECPADTLYPLFAAQAARRPDAPAVVFNGRTWRYRELEAAAGRIAATLRAAGVAKGTLVAIALERSFDMIAGLLGILRAGAAYLPLDPAFPPARLALMLGDADPAVVLTQRSLGGSLPETAARIVFCEDCAGAVDDGVCTETGGGDLAYVLYTSGSTGKPNGVAVPLRALVNLLASMQREPGFGAQNALLAVTTLSFDIAALELFLPLIAGGRVILADRETATDPWRLAALIRDSGCTMMQATPATWRGLIDAGWRGDPRLTLLCGGEALSRDLADRLMQGGSTLWNVYGPTETTIWSTLHRVSPGPGPVPIGRPLANTRIYILDPQGAPMPVGIPGDLFIGGAGVAHGYLNRAELTAQRFVPDPFAGEPGARMYRTGDVARYLPDGAIEYLGRCDRQIKIRGFRIEPGEIETALLAHPAVCHSAVIVRAEMSGDERLIAYLVAADAARPDAAALRRHLAAGLPNYMLPNAFVWLDALPMTPNGKIDRNALPAPGGEVGVADFVAPEGEREEKLAAIWRDILGTERVGATDDFFDLGGHSLLVMPLCRRIETEFGRRLSITAVFYGPTIRQIAALLGDGAAARTVTLQAGGTRPPLYWIDPGPIFAPLAKALGPDQPFTGLMFNTVVTTAENRPSRIADIAPYLVDSIRAAQPEGPYYLGGWCADGLLAYDVASRLIASGQEVGLLVLLHAGNPRHIRRLGTFAVRFSLLKHQLRKFGRMRSRELRGFAAERAGKVVARLLRRAAAGGPPGHYFDGIIDRTAMHYEPLPYPGDIALFQPIERPDIFDYRPGWEEIVTGTVTAYDVPGGHHTMLHEPNVRVLADKLRAALDRAQAGKGRTA